MKKSIMFIHPDLGIGGAERAIVDAAIAMKKMNNDVTILTNHHDETHCFDETKSDGELNVVVAGDFIPRSIFNRFCALFAYIRFLYLCFYLLISRKYVNCDLIYVDQITIPIPFLKLFRYKVLFYAHFPDFLLSKPQGKLKAAYRIPIDFIEKFSLSFADKILFNSKYTKSVYEQHFNCIDKMDTDILYPVPNFSNLVSYSDSDPLEGVIDKNAIVLLSINRYEEKKNIKLAIEAFAQLKQWISDEDEDFNNIHFVHMGGYDENLLENLKTYEHLKYWITSFRLMENVHMLKSTTNDEKVNYLKRATALIYTPSNEHFGIVPIEAMYLGVPVIAANSGGPLETVLDGKTGFLCPSSPVKFAEAMKELIGNQPLRSRMSDAAKEHIQKNFSFISFQQKLEKIIGEICKA